MADVHKMALVVRLLEGGVPMGVAALTADAVHPFAELGRWTPDRKAEKAARKISKEVASSIGRGAVNLEVVKAKTIWAFEQYAQLAPAESEARTVWEQAAGRDDLS